jgi:tetratricopeptide (TPR) repeat protein
MAHIWRLSRRCVFVVFFAPLLLAAQEKTEWDQHYQDGAKALAAGHYDAAVDSLTAALQDAQSFPPMDLRRSSAAHLLANSYELQGKFDRAEALYLEAKSIREANGDAGRKLVGVTLDSLAQLYFVEERWKEAEELQRHAIEVCRQSRGESDPFTITANRHLAEIYSTEGRLTEAEPILQQVIEAARQNAAAGLQLLPLALRDQAFIIVARGQYNQAEPLLKEALDLSRKLGEDRSDTADSLLALALLYRTEGENARAEPLLRKAAGIYEKYNDPCLAHALLELGLIAVTEGKYAVARQNILRSISIYQSFLGPDHVNVAFAQVGLAEAYLGERNYAEAQSVIDHALAKERAVLSDSHGELARAYLTAARISEAQRRGSQAAAHYRQALDIYRRTTTSDNPRRVMAEQQYERFSKSFRK